MLTTHYSLLTTHHLLLTTHYSLLTTHYSLFSTRLFPDPRGPFSAARSRLDCITSAYRHSIQSRYLLAVNSIWLTVRLESPNLSLLLLAPVRLLHLCVVQVGKVVKKVAKKHPDPDVVEMAEGSQFGRIRSICALCMHATSTSRQYGAIMSRHLDVLHYLLCGVPLCRRLYPCA